MRTLTLCLGLVSIGLAGDLDIQTAHKTIEVMTATSPFTVELTKQHAYYAFYLSDSTGKTETGNSCTFQAAPGFHDLRIVGSDWVDGVFRPVTQLKSTILIVEAIPEATYTSDTFTAIEAAPAAIEQQTVPVATKRPEKTLAGVTIYMKKAKPPFPCESCDAWDANERKEFTAEGATIIDVVEQMDVQPFWRVKWDGSAKPTKWDDQYMDRERLEGHLGALSFKP